MKLGRVLTDTETVDHIDHDHTNDDHDNLQVLSLSENAKKASRANGRFVLLDIDHYCSICNSSFRHHVTRQICFSAECKAALMRKVSLENNLRPPPFTGRLGKDKIGEICTLSGQQLSTKEISEKTGLSQRTVLRHRKRCPV